MTAPHLDEINSAEEQVTLCSSTPWDIYILGYRFMIRLALPDTVPVSGNSCESHNASETAKELPAEQIMWMLRSTYQSETSF